MSGGNFNYCGLTDDERREVARRLREAAGYYEIMERDVDFYPVERALGLKPTGETTYTPESVRSLADLIDPDLSKSVPEFDSSAAESDVAVKGRTVDRDTLLELAEEMVETFRLGVFTGEGLDAKWCRELHDKYARRIREAGMIAS